MLRVIHMGAAVDSQGGVASVIANLLAEQSRDPDLQVSAVATTAWRKNGLIFDALLFIPAMVRVLTARLKNPRPILHLHLCSRGSAVRKAVFVQLARLLGIPCVVQDHGIGPYYRRTSALMKALLHSTFKHSTAIITLTERERDFVASLVCTPVEAIPNGTRIPDHVGGMRSAPDTEPRFLYLAKIIRAKGIFELLDAFSDLCRNGCRACLTVAGNGDVETVRAWVREHNLDQRIDVPGWLEGDRKEQALRTADVLVLPSHRESFGVCIIEAMSYGLPVIATRVGGIPEVVVENETGLLVELHDVVGLREAMRRLIADPALRLRMGQAGRTRAESHFSLPAVCARIKAVYQQVARNSGSARRS